jgi:hypothetical protein
MKQVILFFCLISVLYSSAQTNLLLLEKDGVKVKTFATGMSINFETVYHQWLQGSITAIRHDSIFVDGYPFHYTEIATIKTERAGLNYEADGYILMIAGGGVLLLNAVNGAYRGDNAKTWYTHGSFITAGALLVGGFLLSRLHYKKFHIGKKYTLEYLALDLDK